MKILIVDDDPRLRDLLSLALERSDFTVSTVADGQSALREASRGAPDLIILDVGMPEMDGFETCRRIRARSNVPILFLTARDDEIDRILGLELGADDYVTKPFSPREVVARVKAILKRSGGGRFDPTLDFGPISLHPGRKQCLVGGCELALTSTEFELLSALMADPSRLVSRTMLFEAVWGRHSTVSDRTLDSHLRNLRHKLEKAGCPDVVETVHGQGFRLGLTQ